MCIWLRAMASSLKVSEILALLRTAVPGGFACGSQAQLIAELKDEKRAKAAKGELLEEEEEEEEDEDDGEGPAKSKGKGTVKGKGKGTRGRGVQQRPAMPHQQPGASALMLAEALKAYASELPKESSTGHTSLNKRRAKVTSTRTAKGHKGCSSLAGGSEDQLAGVVEPASTLAAAQGEPHEPVEVPNTLSRVSPLGDTKLTPAKDDPASTRIAQVDVRVPKTLCLSKPVDAESAAILAAGCAAEPMAATTVATATLVPVSMAAPGVPRLDPFTEAWTMYVKKYGRQAWLASHLRVQLLSSMTESELKRRRIHLK